MLNSFSDPLAMQSIKQVVNNIEKSAGGDTNARAEMHYAQAIAGMAISNGFLGIFEKHLNQMAAGAVEDPCTPSNPREVSVEDMKKIYIAAYNGNKINF